MSTARLCQHASHWLSSERPALIWCEFCAQVPGAVDGNIDDRGGFQRRLNAALITGLQPVNSFTKIIIMDGRGGGAAKALAREVSALGYRGYHFQGGFRAWKNTGLATMEDGEYGVSAGATFLRPLIPFFALS